MVLSGCGGTFSQWGDDRGGRIEVTPVESAPEGATVTNASSFRSTADELDRVLSKAAEENGTVRVEKSATEMETLERQLSDVPRYDGTQYGYYVRVDGQVFRLRLIYDR